MSYRLELLKHFCPIVVLGCVWAAKPSNHVTKVEVELDESATNELDAVKSYPDISVSKTLANILLQ